jgi:hypothetical protein
MEQDILQIKDVMILVEKRLNGLESSINDLALATKAGFEEVDRKFDELRTEFKQELEYRFNSLSNRIDSITLDYIPRREDKLLKERVEKVERKVGIKYIPNNP